MLRQEPRQEIAAQPIPTHPWLDSVAKRVSMLPARFGQFVSASNSLIECRPLPLCLRLVAINTVLMILCIIVGMLSEYNEPGRYFREGRLMTWISTFQLAAVGYICHRVYVLTRTQAGFSRNPGSIWRLTSIGFYFLAVDELMKVHEAVDRYSHKLMGVIPTKQSDHLDDLILCIYALAGLVILALNWKQVLRYAGCAGFALFAFAFSALSLWLDFLSADREELFRLFGAREFVPWFMTWFGVIEEVCKTYAEIFFIGAALYCLHKAYQIDASGQPAKPDETPQAS